MENLVKYTLGNDPPPLYEQIADIIRKDIMNANVRPGERLLPEDKLTASFNVSLVTVQRALKVLTEERLLIRNRRGTYVSQDALQLANHKTIGLIMPRLGTELTLSQSPAHYLLFDGIQKFCNEHFWNVQILHNKFHSFSWKQFSQSHIAGIIVVMPDRSAYELIAELKKRQIPFICINLHSEKMNHDVNFINIDFYNAAIDAVQYLHNEGRKNIALINARKLTDDIHHFHVVRGYEQATKI
ncbi:MAG: GntR family transcriptional regulator, partial [Victivallaceae bacterium]|nr:GntR family transcriptional regulator [Victivallaceae bacterium]